MRRQLGVSSAPERAPCTRRSISGPSPKRATSRCIPCAFTTSTTFCAARVSCACAGAGAPGAAARRAPHRALWVRPAHDGLERKVAAEAQRERQRPRAHREASRLALARRQRRRITRGAAARLRCSRAHPSSFFVLASSSLRPACDTCAAACSARGQQRTELQAALQRGAGRDSHRLQGRRACAARRVCAP